MLVVARRSDDPTVSALEVPVDRFSRLLRFLRRRQLSRSLAAYGRTRPAGYELFSDTRSEYTTEPPSQMPRCEVINLHWVSGFIDYEAFFTALDKSMPIVWTLHDMNAFTGGCHYDHGCGKYMEACGACPQLGSSDTSDLSHQVWRRKHKVFEKIDSSRLHIVAPSRWLAREAERSSVLSRFPISVIPYGLNLDDFAPRDRGCARNMLGVPQRAKVVLFVAEAATTRRKGFALLTQALSNMTGLTDLFFISLGNHGVDDKVSVPHLQIKHTDDDRLLSMIYSAADLFIIPSLQDNLPNTVLEAMSCGVPVVGFDVGGVSDMVRSGTTGELVPAQDVEALSHAVTKLLQDGDRRLRMSSNSRSRAVEEYGLEMQARRYTELYQAISDDRDAHRLQGRLATNDGGVL